MPTYISKATFGAVYVLFLALGTQLVLSLHMDKGIAASLLNAHKELRESWQINSNMAWNDSVAKYAEERLQLLTTKKMPNTPLCGLTHEGVDGYGENLASVTNMNANPDNEANVMGLLRLWAEQAEKPQVGKYTHFTQMIWSGSTQLGCAAGKGCGDTLMLVCSYYPPGNVLTLDPYSDNPKPAAVMPSVLPVTAAPMNATPPTNEIKPTNSSEVKPMVSSEVKPAGLSGAQPFRTAPISTSASNTVASVPADNPTTKVGMTPQTPQYTKIFHKYPILPNSRVSQALTIKLRIRASGDALNQLGKYVLSSTGAKTILPAHIVLVMVSIGWALACVF